VTAALRPDTTREERDLTVGFRMRRQQRRGELQLWMIITEEVLLRQVAGHLATAEQLQALATAAQEHG